jgi:hypothetical protein
MTKPVTGQGGVVPGDEVARHLGLCARAVCYGRRGLRDWVPGGPPGRWGPGWAGIGKAARWRRVTGDRRS